MKTQIDHRIAATPSQVFERLLFEGTAQHSVFPMQQHGSLNVQDDLHGLMGYCQIRIDQGNSNSPLMEIFTSRGRLKLGKTAPNMGFWHLQGISVALYRLMGYRQTHLDQAHLDLPFMEIFTTRGRLKLGKTAPNVGFWDFQVISVALYRLMGCRQTRLGKTHSDLPHMEIFTTRVHFKFGKTT